MFTKLYNHKIARFLVAGGIAFLINLGLMYWMVDGLGWNTPTLRNVANVLSIEISLVVSFFIYRIWVWTGGNWTIKDVLWIQLPLYHLAAGVAILLRVALIFPLLDWWRVSYGVNTAIGVSIGAVINYMVNDNLIFKSKNKPTQTTRKE